MCKVLFILFLVSASAMGARVIEVAADQSWAIVSHPEDYEWVRGHALCVYRKEKKLACGIVDKASEFEAWLNLETPTIRTEGPQVWENKMGVFVQIGFRREPIHPGDLVREPEPEREIASVGEETEFTEPEEKRVDYAALLKGHIFPVTSLTLGLDYIFPTLHFQHALTQKFATGLAGLYVRYPGTVGEMEGVGGQLTFNFYADGPYQGMFWKFGLGLYEMDAIVSGSYANFLAASGTVNVGYKWRAGSGVSFGLGVGAQYFVALATPSFGFQMPGVIPSIAMEIGFTF